MEKKKYSTPKVQLIELDNEISLALQSTPPEGPGESYLQTPVDYQNSPFKDYLG